MAQTPWQDLIPYYVARTLPPAQMQAFEAQLARDPSLRTELEEWRRIAAAVWREADAAARRLPPLSPEIYQKLQYRNGAQPTNPTSAPLTGQPIQYTSRINASPLTLVAGFLVVFLCGGIVLFAAMRQMQKPEVISTSVALNITSEFGGPAGYTATPVPTILNVCNTQPSLCTTATLVPSTPVIRTWTPVPQASTTAVVVRPTSTPLRPLIQPSQTPRGVNLTVATATANAFGDNVAMTQTYEAIYGTLTPWPDYLCVVTNSTGSAQTLYAAADYNASTVGFWSEGETTWVMARTASNWIEIFYGQWLPAGNLIFRGPCDAVPEPSPTAPSTGSGYCMMTNDGPNTVILYASASAQAQVVNYLPVAQTLYVAVRSGNWFEVYYNQSAGWFQPDGNSISFSGDCGNLPMPSPTYVATTTPTPGPTEVPLTVVFGRPMNAVTRGQVSFYSGPYYNSGVAMTADIDTFWPTTGLVTIAGIEWAALPMNSGQTLWVESSLVSIIDPTIPTATP